MPPLLAVIALLSSSLWAAEPTAPPGSTGEDQARVRALTEEILARHPSLVAAEAATEQLRAASGTGGFRPDPSVGIEVSNLPVDSLALSASPMAGIQFRVSQPLRWPGTAESERAALEARVALGETAEEATRRRLAVEIGRSVWRLAGMQAQELLLVEHAQALGELEGALQARYEVGSAGRSSLWRLELLRERLQADHDALDEAIFGLQAELNLRRGLGPQADLEAPRLKDPVPPPPAGGSAPALAQHPEVAAAAARAEAAEASARSAELMGRPMATLSAGYRLRTVDTAMDSGADMVSLGVTVPVGVAAARQANAKSSAALSEAEAARRTAEAALETLEQRRIAIEAAWRDAWVRAQAAGGPLHDTAESLRQTTLSDYRLGRAGFDELIDAEVHLISLEHERLEAVMTTAQLAVEWEALTGYSAESPETAP